MRLIDADELNKGFKDSPVGSALKKLIDMQPTAYDIDKVVKELESIECASGAYERKCWLDKAIEIVKQGVK